jgi:hypothetical protein
MWYDVTRCNKYNHVLSYPFPDSTLHLGHGCQDDSWSVVGIPVQQLPSLVVAHGILDSVATLHSKQLPELVANAKRMGIPLEHKPDREERVGERALVGPSQEDQEGP